MDFVGPVQAQPGPGMVLIPSSINKPWPRLGLAGPNVSHNICSCGTLSEAVRGGCARPCLCPVRSFRPFSVRLRPCTWKSPKTFASLHLEIPCPFAPPHLEIPSPWERKGAVPKIVFFQGARVPFFFAFPAVWVLVPAHFYLATVTRFQFPGLGLFPCSSEKHIDTGNRK